MKGDCMNTYDFSNKKIAVIGLGGVGGYLGCLLADAYPHVSFVARGSRYSSIAEHGLILHSDYRGERTIHPERIVQTTTELEPQDYIFICVKNYSLDSVCQTLHHCITDHTVIVPVMNGADPGDRTRQNLPQGIVVDSLIYIVSFANADYSITQQGDFANLFVGIQHASEYEKEVSNQVCQLLNNAGIDCQAVLDIQTEIWRKYILNCAYNVETAFYNLPIGQLRTDPQKSAEYEALVNEAFQVARAKGVQVTDSHRNAIIHRFYHELADNATSSLQRDVVAGNPTELETFSGYIIKQAHKLKIPVPVSERMYYKLRELTGKNHKPT